MQLATGLRSTIRWVAYESEVNDGHQRRTLVEWQESCNLRCCETPSVLMHPPAACLPKEVLQKHPFIDIVLGDLVLYYPE